MAVVVRLPPRCQLDTVVLGLNSVCATTSPDTHEIRVQEFQVDITAFMRDAGIGRVLVASLHQGIADILPTRLAFLRELAARRGPARRHDRPRAALRGPQLSAPGRRRPYETITTCAGEYAAEWTVESMAPLERTIHRRRRRRGCAAGCCCGCWAGSCTRATRAAAWSRGSGADRPAWTCAGRSSATVREPVSGRCAGFMSRRSRGCTRCSISPRASRSRRAAAWRAGCLMTFSHSTTVPPADQPSNRS